MLLQKHVSRRVPHSVAMQLFCRSRPKANSITLADVKTTMLPRHTRAWILSNNARHYRAYHFSIANHTRIGWYRRICESTYACVCMTMLIRAFDAWRNIGLRKIGGGREFTKREGHSLSKAVVVRNDVDLRVYQRVYTDTFTPMRPATWPSRTACRSLDRFRSIDRVGRSILDRTSRAPCAIVTISVRRLC